MYCQIQTLIQTKLYEIFSLNASLHPFISCIILHLYLTRVSPCLASHEQGPEHTTRSVRDDRQHILASLHRDAAPLWHCSEAPGE